MPYFFIDKYSETGDRIVGLTKKRKKVRKHRVKFTKELGASEYLVSNFNNQLSGFRFTSVKSTYKLGEEREFEAPAGLRFDNKHHMWVLKLSSKEGKKLKADIAALPRVVSGDINEVFGLPRDNMPCVNKIEKCVDGEGWVVFIGDVCNPLNTLDEDCTEIKKSEYYRLLGE